MKKLVIGFIVAFSLASGSVYACYSITYESSDSTTVKCPSGSKYTILSSSKGYYRSGSGFTLTYFRIFDKAAKAACSC